MTCATDTRRGSRTPKPEAPAPHAQTPEQVMMTVLSREQKKARTHETLLDAALSETLANGFAGVSLRQITRTAGIVPAAFYRHFTSMDELGLVLVERSFATLRTMIRDARADPRMFDKVIERSAELLTREVLANRADFAFIARERFGGVPVVRQAIREELGRFVDELAADLAGLPDFEDWSSADTRMAARLFVNHMVSLAEQIIDLPSDQPELEAQVANEARRQLRLIVVGVAGWRSSAS
jgi:AcrR family transcriptional regulator